MSVAECTRAAVREEPFLYDALAAGVVNYSAAARALDVDGDEESIATALRRFAEELEPAPATDARASVRLHRGVSIDADAGPGTPDDALVTVGATALLPEGDLTAIQATGDVAARDLERVLARLRTNGIDAAAAGVTSEALVVAVPGRDGTDALRLVEAALD